MSIYGRECEGKNNIMIWINWEENLLNDLTNPVRLSQSWKNG